jgi:hypothetical protein
MTSPATAAAKSSVVASATPTMHSPRPARPVPPAPSKQPAATSDVTVAGDAAEGQPMSNTCKTAIVTDDGDSSSGLPDGSGVLKGSVRVLNSSHKPSNTANSRQSTDTASSTTAGESSSGGLSAGTSAAAQVAHEKQAADSTAMINTATAIAEQSNIGDAMDIDNAEDRYVCNVCICLIS